MWKKISYKLWEALYRNYEPYGIMNPLNNFIFEGTDHPYIHVQESWPTDVEPWIKESHENEWLRCMHITPSSGMGNHYSSYSLTLWESFKWSHRSRDWIICVRGTMNEILSLHERGSYMQIKYASCYISFMICNPCVQRAIKANICTRSSLQL